MLTIRMRLFAALEAICDRLLLRPGASPQDQADAIQDAWSIAHAACGLRDGWDTEEMFELESRLAELPD